jgi:O-antigen/teichoic acid export membrane protein
MTVPSSSDRAAVPDGPPAEPTRAFGRGDGTFAMVAGAVASALGAYLFQLIGGRALGDDEFAPIAILWTLQFLGFTILFTPIEQYIIRRLTLSGGRANSLRSAWGLIVGIIGFAVVAVVVYVTVTLDDVFFGDPVFIVAAAVLFATLGSYAIARGFLAGRRRFRDYGLAVGLESVLRLALLVAVLLLTGTAIGVAWAMALAPLAFLLVRPFRKVPPAEPADTTDEASAGAFLGGLLVATSASQAILAGGALIVEALGASNSEVSVFFITFTLFRGPLTASYNLLAKVLSWFTDRTKEGESPSIRRRALQIGVAGAALSVLGGIVGALLGPEVVELLFGSEFRPDAGLAALAAAGVVLAATALLLGQLLIARGTTAILGALWIGALVVATLVVIVVDGTASQRVGWGFLAGELAALAATMWFVARSPATSPAPA